MSSSIFKIQAKVLKILAQPKRLEIIHLLRNQRLNVTEIYTMLGMSQANASQHLMVLRAGGVVVTEREGKEMYYSLANPKIIEASDSIREWLLEQQRENLPSELSTPSLKDLLPIATDPVCGMKLSPLTASFSGLVNGQAYYFCASGCHDKFMKNPAAFL